MPGCGATLHFVPGGRSLVKSNTQVLSSTQRPVPAWVPAGVHVTSIGAGSRGSPNLTMDSLNVARTWRTSATSPTGDIVFSAASARAANGIAAANAIHPAARPRLHCMTCSPACGEAVYVGQPVASSDRERSLTRRSAVSRDSLLRIDLVEDAAVGEVRRLRLGPATEGVVDREGLDLGELARVLRGHRRVDRAVEVPCLDLLRLGRVEIVEVGLRDRARSLAVDHLVDDGHRRLGQDA